MYLLCLYTPHIADVYPRKNVTSLFFCCAVWLSKKQMIEVKESELAFALKWLKNEPSSDLILGYGSLLSDYSRNVYSDIQCPSLCVTVQGYAKGWVTRSEAEMQTYLGAWQQENTQLDAHLLPVEFSADFQKREQDYEFVEVSKKAIRVCEPKFQARLNTLLEPRRIWICKSLAIQQVTPNYPVNASYVVTCLLGCVESGGIEYVKRFIEHTLYWPQELNNDLHAPLYPRHASFQHPHINKVLASLEHAGLLKI